jgi:hypothetical protein
MILSAYKRTTSQLPLMDKSCITYQHLVVHTPIGDVGLVILVLVSAPLADVVHKFKFIELTLRALRDVGMLDVVHKFKSIELILRALRDVGMLTHHQVQASRHSSNISTIATSTNTSTISPTRPKRRTQTSSFTRK